MEPKQRILLRAAECIRSQLYRAAAVPAELDLPDEHWSQCQTLHRQLKQAKSRAWSNARRILEDRLDRVIASCLDRMQELSRQMSACRREISPPTIGTLFTELAALDGEFDAVSVDLVNETVSVTTWPVVLEDVALGQFEIRLRWNRIGGRRPYDVIALDPNPSGESDDVTHPHVRSGQLCEGEGRMAIERALSSGRLLDFFQIVTRVLHTYNAESAYISLSNWDGVSCSGCGAPVPEDERSYCNRCEDDLCSECLITCSACDNRCCSRCTESCRACDGQLCAGCQCTCDRCDRTYCGDCLSEIALCEECQEHDDEATLEEEDVTSIEPAASVASPTRDASPASAQAAAPL